MSSNTPLIAPLENATIEWQPDGAPWSPVFEDVYFSRAGGMDETAHVFLAGNDLPTRWQALATQGGSHCFTIVELGFGSGLNFLCSWQLWRQLLGTSNHRLHFISCERYPLRRADLQRALQQWPTLQPLAAALLALYPDHSPGCHRLLLSLPGEHCPAVTLDLYFGEALEQLRAHQRAQVSLDACFLDGFTPSRNPDLWQDPLLAQISAWSGANSTLASYSVTGRVLRQLRELGWNVEKRDGFAHKRHMLSARFAAHSAQRRPQPASNAVVVGAGLAGCTVAWSLARRGISVTVIDQAEGAAKGASGNPQAILQCRLNRVPDAQWQFNLQAYLFAARWYQWLQHQGLDFDWHACGVLTLEAAYQNTRSGASPQDYAHYPQAVLQALDANQGSNKAGLPVPGPGLFMPHGGWLNPARLCQQLLQQPNIRFLPQQQVHSLQQQAQGWQLLDAAHQVMAEASCVVLCNSYLASRLEHCAALPLSPLRGQISQLPVSTLTEAQRSVICGKSYLAPASNAQHCIGASYVKHSEQTTLSDAEHETVLQALLESVPALQEAGHQARPARAAVRGQSGDFMPLAGPVPHPAAWQGVFGGAQLQGAASPALHPDLLPGLFISAGHGSHGMASCPLLAEHIAALICGEASPLSQAQTRLLEPWRFVARHHRRQRRQAAGPS